MHLAGAAGLVIFASCPRLADILNRESLADRDGQANLRNPRSQLDYRGL